MAAKACGRLLRSGRRDLRDDSCGARMFLMEVTVEIPEDIARQLHAKWENLPRGVLESLALEAYRSGNLTTTQLRRLLGFQTPMDVDAFLKQAGIYLDYDLNDLGEDLETIRRVQGE
jgi:hypothetical protein